MGRESKERERPLEMKVLFIDWNSYCNEDMKSALLTRGYSVRSVCFPDGIRTCADDAEKLLGRELEKGSCDFVFSFNYFPIISGICQKAGIKYLSWVYDSPHIQVYSYTVLNTCNHIFLFDYGVYEELRQAGITTVHYLPLAVNAKRLSKIDTGRNGTMADISFVGSLYTEQKHRIYDKFKDIKPYVRGYLDAIMQAQKNIYGQNFLKELLRSDIMDELERVYPTDPNASTVMSPEAVYADYVFSRQVTAMERWEILALLGERHRICLYTNDGSVRIPGVQNQGATDYYRGMPGVFANSRINLNITLRSIRTGIPLRAWDIMGSGGFLLTNFQQEYLNYFEPGSDFIYYDNYEDLAEKADYYLTHEKERREIALSGCEKVRSEHTYEKRVDEMIRAVWGKEERHENNDCAD
jgi:spore maturation protein CgeB